MKRIAKKGLLLILVLTLVKDAFSQAPNITYTTASLTVGVPVTISPANTGGAVPATTYGQVATFAGSPAETAGYVDGSGTAAQFNWPQQMTKDGSGNLYVADAVNNVIRMISPSGVVSTFAGSIAGLSGATDGTGTSALFSYPDGIAIDGTGNLWVSDYSNNAIRKITPAGVVSTFYSSVDTFGPGGLCFDASGNLIVAAQDASQIISITPAGVATTIAGSTPGYANGTGTAAQFNVPTDVKMDVSGNFYVADYENNAIRKIDPSGVVTTIAGSTVNGNTPGFADGSGTAAIFNNPVGLAIGPGGVIYVADMYNNDIRRIMPDGTVSLMAGSTAQAPGDADGTGTAAGFNQPDYLYLDNTGAYIAELGGNRIRQMVLTGYTLKGTLPAGLTFDPTTGVISGTPTGTITGQTNTVTAYNTSGYSVATVTFSAGSQNQAPNITYTTASLTVGVPVTISPANTGGAVPATTYGQVATFAGSPAETAGYVDGSGTAAQFNWPQQMTKDGSGNLYVADAVNNVIRMISPSGVVSTFAGSIAGLSGATDGTGTSALFSYPDGIAIDGTGNLWVSDYSNNAIRKITPAGVVSTFYSSVDTFGPGGLCFDASGNLIVAAQDASQIISITPAGVATTIAGSTPGYANGTGTAAQFNVPTDVKMDVSGNFYVADYENNAIRKIDPSGVVTTIAGSTTSGNTPGFADGSGTAAIFNNPVGLAIGPGGVIYVADMYNNDIRRIMPDGTVSLMAGSTAQAPGDADGTGTAAGFNQPDYLYLDNTGAYIAELGGNRIRQMVLTGYTLKGTLPAGLTFDPATGVISGTPAAVTATTTLWVTAYNAFGFATTMLTVTTNQGLPSNPSNDDDRNWLYVRTYDENGSEIAASKSFFDNNGKATQTQSKNETTGNVLAVQTLYDVQGRAVLNTLAAPINNSAFAYSSNFVTNNGNPYSYLNFDGDPANTAAPYAKLNNPDLVDKTSPGTLGWYYSDNNTSEAYVAATGYPYGRDDFYRDGTGAAKRSAGIGEQLKMGTGRELISNSFPVQNELNNYLAIRNQFFPAAMVGGNPTNMAGQALQSVSTDQNGLTVLSVTDLSGKQKLMTGRADPSGWLTVTNSASISNVQTGYTFTINTDQGIFNGDPSGSAQPNDITGFTINSTANVVVSCLTCDVPDTYNGPGNLYVFPSGGVGFNYQITSALPFTVNARNSAGTVYSQAEASYAEPAGASTYYFQLAAPSTVTLTGNYTLINMASETDATSTFPSGTLFPAGYYKVIALAPTDNTTNTVTIAYANTYTDISYNYYNQLGQLIASIAPNGVQALIANPGSYPNTGPIPFVSLYSYDLQGRLTSTTSPDGGTSNYIYRQDGKIRFSQNALQRNRDGSGAQKDPAFVEKFSYTNYDPTGRPIESGEYVIPNGTAAVFAGLVANTTVLETTDPAGGLSGGTKLSQINTYYDLPDPNFSLSGYVQDAGFLKGVVSYTTNANSSTWYNYDDHGRVTWTVKQLNGLTVNGQPAYKTVDYTYNDQGNVTRVDYQKGTSGERFIHYYVYDADGRLVNVQTSRDDINKIQQANYYYYLHGPLKRVELGDHLQGIDYVYTPQGWLKSINTPTQVAGNDPGQDGIINSFATDVFGMQIEYFPGDYSRTGSNINGVLTGQQSYYNGQVNGISWQSNKPSSVLTGNPGIQSPAMYTYNYDPKYQLTNATWGTPTYTGTSSFAGSSINNEKNITYDFNGNITSLQRTYNPATTVDDFSKYTYQSNTNQLVSVGNTANLSSYASYAYDDIGRMKSETLTGAPNPYYLTYDVNGKITGIYADQALTQLMVSYAYDESGNRIKTVNPNGTTWYIYDTKGNVLTIYTGTTPVISEVPVYGSGNRLGTYTFSNNNYVYELRDNVGSVRVVINHDKNSSGQADISTYDDYFPFGSIVQRGGNLSYRYDYQGAYAEKDPYTNWNNFQLRMYDGRVGRWLSVDPKGQFSSPYEGMGNNPVNGFDKDGGFFDWVLGAGGDIYWDANAVDQSTTKAGDKYLGLKLTFAFDSYIDPDLWDGPLGKTAAGDKMESIIWLTASKNSSGELTGISATKKIIFGNTPVLSPRDFYPGLGDDQNKFNFAKTMNADGTLATYGLNFEEHASVSWLEDMGLHMIGYDIPDVGQKLNVNYANGHLSITTYTDQFPSAMVSMNGRLIMYYAQPSFESTFYNPTFTSPTLDPDPGYIPARWYKRSP